MGMHETKLLMCWFFLFFLFFLFKQTKKDEYARTRKEEMLFFQHQSHMHITSKSIDSTFIS